MPLTIKVKTEAEILMLKNLHRSRMRVIGGLNIPENFDILVVSDTLDLCSNLDVFDGLEGLVFSFCGYQALISDHLNTSSY